MTTGTIQDVIKVSFHWVIKATTKAAMNADTACTNIPSFSATPDWISFPLEVVCMDIEPLDPWSKKAISWLKAEWRYLQRMFLVNRWATYVNRDEYTYVPPKRAMPM
jgi:hypothetical protein